MLLKVLWDLLINVWSPCCLLPAVVPHVFLLQRRKSQISGYKKTTRKHFPFFSDYCQTSSPPVSTTAASGIHSSLHICGSSIATALPTPSLPNMNNTIYSQLLFWHLQETAVKITCLTSAPSIAQTTLATTTTPPTAPGSSEWNMARKSSCPSH